MRYTHLIIWFNVTFAAGISGQNTNTTTTTTSTKATTAPTNLPSCPVCPSPKNTRQDKREGLLTRKTGFMFKRCSGRHYAFRMR